MPFNDLVWPNAEIMRGEHIPYTLGTTFWYPLSIIDTDGSLMSLTSGYTASMTLNLPDDTNVIAWTQSLVSGRIINLTPLVDATLVIQSTPAGMTTLASYLERPLAFNLTITNTSSGIATDVMRRCFIIPKPQLA